MDWDDITRQLEQTVLDAFDDLIVATEGQRFYALALVTDDGGMSVGLAANTEDAFQQRLQVERQEDPELSLQDAAWFRWGVGEWRCEGWRDDLFAAVNRRLHDEVVEGRIDDIDAHLARLVEAMTMALAQLRRERGAQLTDAILFATLTDSDDAETIENNSAQRANPPALVDTFRKRYG